MNDHSKEEPVAAPRQWLDLIDWQVPFSILLITLLLTNAIQLMTLLDQARQLNATKTQIDQATPHADQVRDKLEALLRDLVELAKTDTEARLIQEEIHLQPPPPQSTNSQGPIRPNSFLDQQPNLTP